MKNVALSFALAVAVLTPAAFAGPVTWTQWTGATAGTNGSATGTMGSTTVSYSGQTSGPTSAAATATAHRITSGFGRRRHSPTRPLG